MTSKGTVLLFGSTTSEVVFDIQRAVEAAGYQIRLLSCKRKTFISNLDANALQVLLMYLENIERHHYEMIMDLLSSESFSSVPLIVVGRADECDELRALISFQHVTELTRPTSMPAIMEAVEQNMRRRAEMLNIETKDERKVVWVVESDPRMMRLTKSFLDAEYRVRAFISNAQFYAALQTERPHMVVANYQMPGSLGNDMLDALSGMPGCGDLPLIFIATPKERQYAEATLAKKPLGYAMKPLTKRLLQETVAEGFKKI